MSLPILSLIIFLPAVGSIAIALLPKDSIKAVRVGTLLTSLAAFSASLVMLVRFKAAEQGFQFVEKVRWIPTSNASYHLGIDGISLWMVLLTTFLVPLCVLASWGLDKKPKTFHIVLLLLETGILGVFLSLDLLLFYMFWEGMLIPMYFMIGVWGYARRVSAAVKFFLYTLAGSLLMLVGIATLYFLSTPHTFDLTVLMTSNIARGAQAWLFAAFFISFAIKVPIFPLHTWLPDAHTEAPTAGSVILAGVLLKMGAYGFLRFSLPLFPKAALSFAPWLALLGVIGIVYGGAVSIVQKDLKRLVAYSSVSHLGFVVLGISAMNTIATSGSVLQMLNHGLSTGVLFLMIGMLYQRGHTREIEDLSGLNSLMPIFGGMFLLATLSSLGLPGLNGFVGEFLILSGSFDTARVITMIATSGVILAAVYLLWAYERVFMGQVKAPHAERSRIWRDLSWREMVIVVPALLLIVAIGIYPKPFLSRIEPSVDRLVSTIHRLPQGLAER
ncbi:MAG: NuoM family protein [Actinomycetota bacterium]|nr:NADH-quinone oxidoreductase subunit M [Actinomycetota bacterium]